MLSPISPHSREGSARTNVSKKKVIHIPTSRFEHCTALSQEQMFETQKILYSRGLVAKPFVLHFLHCSAQIAAHNREKRFT